MSAAEDNAAAVRRARVRHHQAVWETTTFEVDVPEDVEDVQAWVEENFDVLLGRLSADNLDVEAGDAVEGLDSEIEVEAL